MVQMKLKAAGAWDGWGRERRLTVSSHTLHACRALPRRRVGAAGGLDQTCGVDEINADAQSLSGGHALRNVWCGTN